MPNQFNLDDLPKGNKFALHLESDTPEDAVARRQEKAEEAGHKRKVNTIILNFALLMVFLIFVGCIYEFATGSADDKKWAGAVVSGICAAFLGFVGDNGWSERPICSNRNRPFRSMPYEATVHNIFIASPSDVRPEREIRISQPAWWNT